MAVAVELDIRGVTLDQYDRINEAVGLLPGGPAAEHEIFHWVSKTDQGIHVVDVWESRQAFEDFARHKLIPAFSEMGLGFGAEPRFFEVHNYLPGTGRRH